MLNMDQSEDNIQQNLLLDDTYNELESFSNLDTEAIKKLPFEQRLSILIRRESIKGNFNGKSSLNHLKSGSLTTPKVFKNLPEKLLKPQMSKNEQLLDALDDIDDNLLDEELSFGRISCLEFTERDSIIHGPSFRNNKESMSKISRKSLISRRDSNRKTFNLMDDIDDGLLDEDAFESVICPFDQATD
mmetsp:Transcript_17775/g.15690  ORF Transcript_17775/g.15690 Transcript_17775/m.15690 type:complete len:188 (+) Transcript_17775:604-1167(+)